MKRNSKRDASVIREWNKGEKNRTQVAEEFGVSVATVAGILRRSRIRVLDGRKRKFDRNGAIVRVWNRGKRNMSDIGELFDVSRNAVAGVLNRARANGLFVRSVDPHEAACRSQVSARRKMGEAAYLAAMRESIARAQAVRAARATS